MLMTDCKSKSDWEYNNMREKVRAKKQEWLREQEHERENKSKELTKKVRK